MEEKWYEVKKKKNNRCFYLVSIESRTWTWSNLKVNEEEEANSPGMNCKQMQQ